MNVFQSFVTPSLPGLEEYFNAIGQNFCPFLKPADDEHLVASSVYDLGNVDLATAQETLFYLGLIHTELLRVSRRYVSARYRTLACENVFIRFAGEDEVDGSKLFGWPHWLLKKHYTGVGVMYGKFWKGEKDTSRDQRPIPPSPYHMLSIRSVIVKRDPRFFTKAPELLDTLLAAEDNNDQVFTGMDEEFYRQVGRPGMTAEAVLATSRRLSGGYDLYPRLLSEHEPKARS